VGLFVLNSDFTTESSFSLGNLDADPEDEVLVGGREITGLARGPAFQIYDPEGTFKVGRFVLTSDFTNTGYSIADVASPGILVCGQETGGAARGPAFQIFDAAGNFALGCFALTSDFAADHQCLRADLDGIAGDEVIIGGRETGGLGRGPAFQIYDSNGDFVVGAFALNGDFSNLKVFTIDEDGDGEIGIGGVETGGLMRGPAIQLWESDRSFILGKFAERGLLKADNSARRFSQERIRCQTSSWLFMFEVAEVWL